jgi:hypothetical protein
MYRYSSSFLKNETEKILEVLQTEKFRFTDYSKMVPSFIDTIESTMVLPVLKFLEEHVIGRLGCREKSVHNMLFYFLTKMKDLTDMLTYLEVME